jgi:uncharacterized protein with NRDE domain
MCLLVVFHRAHPDGPLCVAANRDEYLARPADPMTVLVQSGPRILGGRDRVAGGTWLAVNQHGVVAGLTNLPSPVRDPARRSRGELPLALARHADAAVAVAAFRRGYRPADFNPAWLLVGDRSSLHYVDMAGGDAPRVTDLPPGIHVLENKPLGVESPKASAVARALGGADRHRGDALVEFLRGVLRDHEIPSCVHAGPYGTRSAAVIVVPAGAGPPRIWSSDGPPCTHDLREASALWTGAPGEAVHA